MLVLMSVVGFTQHPNKKEVADKNRTAANLVKETKEKADSSDRSKFRKEALVKVRSNQQAIEVLRNRTSFENNAVQRDYKAQILALDKENSELRTAIIRSDEIDKSKWSAFKKELNSLLDALAQAIKDVKVPAGAI